MKKFKLEPLKFSDYAYKKAWTPRPIVPLNRDISGIPIVFQGTENTCVSCSVTWVQQWREKNGTRLDFAFLARDVNDTGERLSQVLKTAKNIGIPAWDTVDKDLEAQLNSAKDHRIPGYFYLMDHSKESIYASLEEHPVIVGVNDFQGIGPHMMVAFDVSEDGKNLKCVNWWDEKIQQIVEVPFLDVVRGVIIKKVEDTLINLQSPMLAVLKDKIIHMTRNKQIIAGIGIIIALAALFTGVNGGANGSAEERFGRSGVALGYSTTIAGSGLSNSATSISVSSLGLYTGETLTASDIDYPAYFVINPGGSTQELIECWGLNTAGSNPAWTGCVRGLSAKGLNATSTVTGAAKTHSAGERFIMTNAPPFFDRFVDRTTAQTIDGVKLFADFPRTTSTTALPSNAWELATKLYVDNIGAGGFTQSNVSSTRGIEVFTSGIPACDSAAACIGVYASSTDSINGGFLGFSSVGRLFWNVVSFLAHAWTWSGEQTFDSIVATTTVANLQITGEASSDNDAMNLSSARALTSQGYATGTAATTIAAGDALYITTAGTLGLADPAATSTAQSFVGISLEAATSTNELAFVPAGAIADNLSGLKIGADYYLSGTAGSITSIVPSIPDLPVKIGRAISANRLLVKEPTIRLIYSAILTNFNSDQTITLGVTPDKVTMMCGNEGLDDVSSGWWARNKHSGTAISTSWGVDDDAVPYTQFNNNTVCQWEEGTSTFSATIDVLQTGFTININATWVGAPRDATYTVEYLYP